MSDEKNASLQPLFSDNASLNAEYDYAKQLDWIIPVTVNIILMVSTLWILISLVDYGRKTGKWRQIQNTKSDHLNAGLVYTSVIICACACMVRYAISLLYMNTGFGEDPSKKCDSTADAAVFFYALVLFTVYFFLWLRQRVFYSTYVVKSAFSKIVSFFSSASIGFIFVAGVGAAVLNILPINHHSSAHGCIYSPDESQRIGYWISVAIAIFIGQTVLLGLFIYPLQRIFKLCQPVFGSARPCYRERDEIKSAQQVQRHPAEVQSTVRVKVVSITSSASDKTTVQDSVIKLSPSFRRTTINLVNQILRRTFIFALLSLSTDFFLLVFSNYIVQTHGHRRVPSMIYDINSFLNLILVVLSFVQYKDMMTSPCRLQAHNRVTCKIKK